MAVGPGDFVYFTDRTDLIRKASPDGVVTTVAGIVGQRGPLDGPAREARLDPWGICVAPDGTVFFTDRASLVRKISPDGVVSTIGGTTGAPWEWMDATGEAARFQSPTGIALDSNGILYVVDTSNYCIRKGFDPTKNPPVLSAAANISSDGDLSLSVFGRENVVVEGTADFAHWYPVHTNRYAGTGLINNLSKGSFEFFRAVVP
jgi:DNA-binding beta-propeller fold protein YncE